MTHDTDTESQEIHPGDNELIVVMDGYNGDWTPSAVVTDPSEAVKLQEMLSEDAEAVCSLAPWFKSKQAVREGETTTVPDDLPNKLSVCFQQDTAHTISDADMAAMEMQFEKDGLRKSVAVHDTAKSVAAEKPAVMGRFIETSGTPAEDILDSIE
jgi:hypothetical protein